MKTMANVPVISVIVPVYNGEYYLKRCVYSILKQSFTQLELILIDDGSTDSTPDLCDELSKLDDRIRVIHQNNLGTSYSRNVGIDIAKGTYIGFVDADDWINVNMYKTLYENLRNYNADISTVRYLITKRDECSYEPKKANIEVLQGIDKLRRYLEIGIADRSNLYSACTKLYKKSLFDNIRFPEGQRFEDIATNFILIDKAETFVVNGGKFYYYYMKSRGFTRSKCSKRDLDCIKASKEIYDLTKGTDIEELGEIIYGRSFYSVLVKLVAYGTDDSIDEKDFMTSIHKSYCAYYHKLIKSNMPMNRKIFMPFLRVCPSVVKKAISLFLG